MEYSEIKAFLNDTPQYGETTGVERAGKLLELLGNPDKNLKIIHIAGTNGKGSVCSYIDDILKKSGYKTGLFTSPVISVYREQFRINGEMILHSTLIRCMKQPGRIILSLHILTFFSVRLCYILINARSIM